MTERPVGGASRRALDALVRHVAEVSVEAVCRLVGNRIDAMSVCEARGYIRARASMEIRRQTRVACAHLSGVDAARQLLIVQRATERVTPQVLRHLASGRARHAHVRSFAPATVRRAA